MYAHLFSRTAMVFYIGLLSASVLVYRPGHVNSLMNAFFDWMHFPVFGLIAVALQALLKKKLTKRSSMLFAFVAASGLGGITEILQIPLDRSATLSDVALDSAGAAAFLLLTNAPTRIGWRPALMAIAALVIFFVSSQSFLTTLADYAERNERFPILFTGDSDGGEDFFYAGLAAVETRWDQAQGRIFSRVSVRREQALRIEFRNLVPDWTAYDQVTLLVGNPNNAALKATIRIHDKKHRSLGQKHADRFNQNYTLVPGLQQIDIPLPSLRRAPKSREMTMERIEAMIIFTAASPSSQALDIYEVRLQ